MSTHIGAEMGDIADTVLMPGDPLRAKYIAENFMENVVQYNKVRNAFGYTGTYKGHKVSVQGTGMGIPSISIYTNELIKFFGVKHLMRVGSIGGFGENIKIRDILIAQSASTDSAIIQNTFKAGVIYAPTADFDMLLKAYQSAQDAHVAVKVGNIFSADRFYNDEIDYQQLTDYGILGTEMETAALYMLAAKYHVQALSINTVSDNLTTGEALSAEDRETSFEEMAKISLETAIKCTDQ
ncbi:purine-nucleoside phosphorylase [Secundilactobacillus paracollinoides]|uniref:Purine nucleoside phosphorylase DeoD-type n=1 Tax=Secundilactobacillus paracollinoides TaxID=240427 RepID=A0A1B2IUX0_9LACO|nr:purine-nucleoside phosphorylase [Secundilactobacillus paracollinoides]ANZ60050.1 purine-nucleoside phosphorylase [Secundilactobacillus paracollinoides]ANZ62997.1 purine-nucleoside phosphorylase [Secundilactobacillus paracollinoides]ANZ65843.1 purine-nucleoside phosphorylase [Secundilactobacillus paracollinoides]